MDIRTAENGPRAVDVVELWLQGTVRSASRTTEYESQRLLAAVSELHANLFCDASWLGKQFILMTYGWDQIRGR